MKERKRLSIIVIIGIFGIYVGMRMIFYSYISYTEIDKIISNILVFVLAILMIPLIKIWFIERKIEKAKKEQYSESNK